MAVTLEATYSKKLGLPGFSSHQYSITIRTELSDLKQVESESARLYGQLQNSVDREIQHTGWLPEATNGHTAPKNGHSSSGNGSNGNSGHHPRSNGQSEAWACSDKQRDLILKIVEEHDLDKQAVDALAVERFKIPVRQLNKLQASGLIEELIETHGGSRANGRSTQPGRKS